MDNLGKIFLIGILSWFYICVVYLVFHPDVCKEYRRFYIEGVLNRYPGKPSIPGNGRFVWKRKYVSGPRQCFSGKYIRVFPEEIDEYMRKVF